ncbi:MAG: hypothetical protein ACTSYF_07190, partial [Promethearchaeota archaeon]
SCTIHASLIAIDGSFSAENSYFSPTARLEILGGVTQRTRGVVGRLNPRRGFDKYYQYDDRLEYMSPQYYPIAPGSTSDLFKSSILKLVSWME